MPYVNDRQAALQQGIDELRNELISLYQKEGCFQEEKVQAKSKELDQLIVDYTKRVLELNRKQKGRDKKG